MLELKLYILTKKSLVNRWQYDVIYTVLCPEYTIGIVWFVSRNEIQNGGIIRGDRYQANVDWINNAPLSDGYEPRESNYLEYLITIGKTRDQIQDIMQKLARVSEDLAMIETELQC